jgi:hypothetical protein
MVAAGMLPTSVLSLLSIFNKNRRNTEHHHCIYTRYVACNFPRMGMLTRKPKQMTKAILILFVSACFTNAIHAQSKTYVGIEGGASHDRYDYVDDGALLKKVPLLSGYFGLTVRQHLSENVFLELGLLRKYYSEGIGFKTSGGYGSSNAINAWFVPLRLGSRINLAKQKVYLTPLIGYTLAINSDYGYGNGGSAGFEINKRDTVSYNVFSRLSLRRTFPLLETGLGVEFLIRRSALISLYANYFTGFHNVIEQDIQYQHNGSSSTAKGLSKGDMLSFTLGVRYPISHLWQPQKTITEGNMALRILER